MPRGPRLDIPGVVQHVIFRGIERREIFRDDKDYKELLKRLSKLCDPNDIGMYAFALMPNHVHLLLRPLNSALSSFMRRLLTGYALYFNRRHRRSGHLFQNRYKSFIVQEDAYLLELIRYIHLNPVRVAIVPGIDALASHPYTAHSALMGQIKYPFVDGDYVLSHFGAGIGDARKALVSFMREGIEKGRQDRLAGGGLKRSLASLSEAERKEFHAFDERILGAGHFVESTLRALERRAVAKASAAAELIERIAQSHNLRATELRSGSKRAPVARARAEAVALGIKEHGISARELADALGVSTPAIYAILRRVGDEG